MITVFTKNIKNISNARVQEHRRALSLYRKEKADKCKNSQQFRQSVEAGYLLERELSKSFGIPMGTAEYGTGERGKPFVKGRPDIIFSMSHTEDAVMVVFAAEETSETGAPCVAVGCDIERVREQKADRRLAERLFSEEEYEYVMRNGELDPEAFCRIWTLKESFAKALGKGLSFSLSDVRISVDGQGKVCAEQSLYGGEVIFKEPCCGAEGCVNAVCVLYECRKG